MKNITSILFILVCFFGHSQNTSLGINLQGEIQFITNSQNNLEIDVLLISASQDTLYFESHTNINLYNENTFNIIIGNGIYLSGLNLNISNVDWYEVDKILLFQKENNNYYNLGHYKTSVHPYSFHSQFNLIPPLTKDLVDTPNSNFQSQNTLFIFNGTSFVESNPLILDTTLYSWNSDTVSFSDTTAIAINNKFSDSTITSLYTDSTFYSLLCSYVSYSNISNFSDSSNISNSSLGNWSLQGNSGTPNNIGTTSNHDLILKTNTTTRFRFTNENGFTNNAENTGFKLNTNGTLFNMTEDSTIVNISKIHLYANKKRSAIHIGSPLPNMDTLFGNYSFAFGDNTGTNGTYSTVFGKNTFGDSALIFGVNYDAISSFALGNSCNSTYVGVAIGYNCKAIYYRNIALGKDVFVGQTSAFLPSAAIGIGNNIISSGATSWAMGNNISATGHFSTALGTNANTNLKMGSFVYGDFSITDTVSSSLNNEFIVRADSGYIFYTTNNTLMGVTLDHGAGSWNIVSNENLKENIILLNDSLNYKSILNTPIYEWQYKNQQTYHIGPMAQTFNSNFNIGESTNYINSGDLDGVIFSGIKYLNQKIYLKDNQISINSAETKLESEKNSLHELQLKIDLLYEKITD